MTIIDPSQRSEPESAATNDPVVNAATETATDDAAAGGDRLRRRWQRWGPEAAVVAASLIINLWSLSVDGLGNTYYAAAIKSMTQSWSNFVFASLDPGGWITVDKPPLAFWAPALSARIFGFSSWSILAPSAVAGAAAVLLVTRTVGRVWGHTAGIVAGVGLATMPTMVAVSRSNNPDVWLVLGVVAAAWALERAIATDRLRWLAWMGVFVGLAFLAKLGAALMVAPALGLAYLVAASCSWRRRIVGGIVATLSMAAVAGAWIVGVALIPLSSRPYIGGSTDGSAWDLVTGYNGIGRLTGSSGGGPGGGGPGGGPGGPGGFGRSTGVDSFGGSTGIGRLFNAGMGDQVMWLVVLAVAAALGATVLLARRRLQRREVGSLVVWVMWALTVFVGFSYASGIFHNYYVSLLAPAIAALVGIGASLVLRSGAAGRIVAASALVITALVQVVLMRRIDELTALRVVVPVALLVAAIVLLAQTRGDLTRRAALIGVGLAASAAMVTPAMWVASSLTQRMSGSFPEARPTSLEIDPGGARDVGLDQAQLTWLRSQRSTETWIVAVDGSATASQPIIDGDSVMAMGGFNGGDDAMTNVRLAELVGNGELRFVITGGGFGGPGRRSSSIDSTVTSVCSLVPSSDWGGTGQSTLYDCAGQADAIAASPASAAAGATDAPPANGRPDGQLGTPPSDGSPVDGGPGGEPPDFAAIQACMADQGIDLSSGPPPRDAATDAALAACGLEPSAGGPPAGG